MLSARILLSSELLFPFVHFFVTDWFENGLRIADLVAGGDKREDFLWTVLKELV